MTVGAVTNPLPLEPLELSLVELSATGAYALAAFVLLRLVDLDLSLSTVVSMAWFLGVAAGAAPLLGAVLVVSEFTWFGLVPSNDLGDTIVSFWIGDAIGVLTVVPLILPRQPGCASGARASAPQRLA